MRAAPHPPHVRQQCRAARAACTKRSEAYLTNSQCQHCHECTYLEQMHLSPFAQPALKLCSAASSSDHPLQAPQKVRQGASTQTIRIQQEVHTCSHEVVAVHKEDHLYADRCCLSSCLFCLRPSTTKHNTAVTPHSPLFRPASELAMPYSRNLHK